MRRSYTPKFCTDSRGAADVLGPCGAQSTKHTLPSNECFSRTSSRHGGGARGESSEALARATRAGRPGRATAAADADATGATTRARGGKSRAPAQKTAGHRSRARRHRHRVTRSARGSRIDGARANASGVGGRGAALHSCVVAPSRDFARVDRRAVRRVRFEDRSSSLLMRDENALRARWRRPFRGKYALVVDRARASVRRARDAIPTRARVRGSRVSFRRGSARHVRAEHAGSASRVLRLRHATDSWRARDPLLDDFGSPATSERGVAHLPHARVARPDRPRRAPRRVVRWTAKRAPETPRRFDPSVSAPTRGRARRHVTSTRLATRTPTPSRATEATSTPRWRRCAPRSTPPPPSGTRTPTRDAPPRKTPTVANRAAVVEDAELEMREMRDAVAAVAEEHEARRRDETRARATAESDAAAARARRGDQRAERDAPKRRAPRDDRARVERDARRDEQAADEERRRAAEEAEGRSRRRRARRARGGGGGGGTTRVSDARGSRQETRRSVRGAKTTRTNRSADEDGSVYGGIVQNESERLTTERPPRTRWTSRASPSAPSGKRPRERPSRASSSTSPARRSTKTRSTTARAKGRPK